MSTLLDFGIKCPLAKGHAPGPIKRVSEPVKTFIEKERAKSSDEMYDTEYIIGYLSKVPSYTFDLRGWPDGLNRQEFDRLWEMGFQDDVPMGEGHFWCDGHFAFALRAAKKMFKADKEKIWQTIERMKKSQFEYFMHSAERDFIQHCKYVCNSHSKNEIKRDIEWAERSWYRHNQFRKELGLPEEPVPEIFALEHMNPLNWGDEER